MSTDQEGDGAGRGRRRHITIAGAGPAGIVTAIKLKEAGFEDFIILERSHGPGGTWHNNRFPGLACDVPSHLYSFTFDQKPDWSRLFAGQAEILEYMCDLVERYDLAPHIHYGAEISSARWDEREEAWELRTSNGWTTASDVFISAIGMFNALHWPDLRGFADFGGRVVHTGAWPAGGVDVAGKRVAVIGTAASGVQLIPEIAEETAQLYVYQRTANWVFPKEDKAFAELQLEEMRRDPEIGLAIRKEYLDYFELLLTWDKPEMNRELAEKGLKNLECVENPVLREKLFPRLPFASQRPLFSDSYYPTFNRADVELVTDPIREIVASGVRTEDGLDRPADVLVVATGYEANRFLSVIDVVGRDGSLLGEEWEDGPQAYLGVTVAGFPNLFMLYGPNTNTGSILYMLELQSDYIVGKLRHMRDHEISSLEVRRDVQDAYNEELQDNIAKVKPWQTVGSRYYRVPSGRLVTQWPLNMSAYRERTVAEDGGAFLERGSTVVGGRSTAT